jgi:hypothetical protein
MPITLSYDLQTDDANHRTYIRSMFERFGWRRLGGSVFRYETEFGFCKPGARCDGAQGATQIEESWALR